MHKLLERQIAKATAVSGEVDLERLYGLVSQAYEEFDRDRIRSDRATRLMIEEVDAHHKAREAALDRLACQNRILDAALAHMAQGVAMFDADQRLVVSNARYAEIYDLPPSLTAPGTPFAQLAEYRLSKDFYVGEPPDEYDPRRVADALSVRSAVHEFKDGRIIAITRRPIQNGGWVTTHEDITERERLYAELKRQHEIVKEQQEQLLLRTMQFDAAINNMTEGLCFFDGEERLIICNKRYIEMYNLRAQSVYPGIDLREVIRLRKEAGHFPNMSVDEFYEQRHAIALAGRPSDTEVELTNGRVLEIHHRPMPDGGWVATQEDITERRRAEAKVAHMAHHDSLTDLPNRVLLARRLEEAIARASCGEMIALHLFDLDHFKNVNDTLGHPVGDKLLRLAGERLKRLVRECDTVARTGGDEFAIIQNGLKQLSEASAFAERLIQCICAPFEIDGREVVVGTSVGIAISPANGNDSNELIRNADLALYRSKAEGRSTYRFFEAEMDRLMKARRALEHDLRKAVIAGQFELHFQPVVDLETNHITCCEALLRWRHPQKGMIQPDAFISLAEEIGAIVPLGEWVIREACRTAASWPSPIKVSVNLSPVQFRNADLRRIVVSALAASGLPPEQLQLEITENVLLTGSDVVLETFNQLRKIGVQIALDDFGVGYSSLAYLRQFSFDNIKIDRSFVREIMESPSSRCIIQAVADLASGLNMIATAEGVETAEQRAAVLAAGCSEIQGFLISRAVPAEQLAELFERSGIRATKATTSSDEEVASSKEAFSAATDRKTAAQSG